MTISNLKDHQLLFINRFDESRITKIDALINEFLLKFPKDDIIKIRKDDYVLGRFNIDHKETFCYWMEKKLENFGKISGSPATQYAVWFGKYGDEKDKEYRHTKKYGGNFDEAFINIKKEIVLILRAGEIDDFNAIAKSKVGDKLKGKILTSYFSERYLSIYSADYLNDILKYFNLDDDKSFDEPAILKQLRLIRWKERNEIMSSWSLKKFAMFINHELYTFLYNTTPENSNNKSPLFPDIADLKPYFLEDCEIDDQKSPTQNQGKKSIRKKKIDYLKKTIWNKAVGDRGEHIVNELEIRFLKENGRSDLAKKVKWVSQETDSEGYDILSWDLEGNKKYIEVKSTTRNKADMYFFLTSHEYEVANSLKNYYLYYVFNILTDKPKVWRLSNPFKPKLSSVYMEPISYKVTIFKK